MDIITFRQKYNLPANEVIPKQLKIKNPSAIDKPTVKKISARLQHCHPNLELFLFRLCDFSFFFVSVTFFSLFLHFFKQKYLFFVCSSQYCMWYRCWMNSRAVDELCFYFRRLTVWLLSVTFRRIRRSKQWRCQNFRFFPFGGWNFRV